MPTTWTPSSDGSRTALYQKEGQATHDDYYGYGLLNVSGLIDLAVQA